MRRHDLVVIGSGSGNMVLDDAFAERATGRIPGAHVLGPQAATLIQPLAVAMTFGIDNALRQLELTSP